MSFNQDARSRIARQTKRLEQAVTPQYRPAHRRVAPGISGSDTELIVARHDEELPTAYLHHDPGQCTIKAVEVEIYRLVPKDPDEIEPGEAGDYMLEAIMDGDEPRTLIVANFSPSEPIPKDEWFAILPTNGRIQMASLWPC